MYGENKLTSVLTLNQVKLAMINIQHRLNKLGRSHEVKMLLMIHDELVFEVPSAILPSISRIIREEMENAIPLSIPLTVNLRVGDSWGELYSK